jgi:hypothetical protein
MGSDSERLTAMLGTLFFHRPRSLPAGPFIPSVAERAVGWWQEVHAGRP